MLIILACMDFTFQIQQEHENDGWGMEGKIFKLQRSIAMDSHRLSDYARVLTSLHRFVFLQLLIKIHQHRRFTLYSAD